MLHLIAAHPGRIKRDGHTLRGRVGRGVLHASDLVRAKRMRFRSRCSESSLSPVTVNSIVSFINFSAGTRLPRAQMTGGVAGVPQQGLRRLRSQIEDKRNADVVIVDLGAYSRVKRQLSDGRICRRREFRAQASG